MSNFTFLSKEQCFGNDKLDILEKRGTKAAITDFSILLGGYVSNYHIDNDRSLEGRAGYYWTKSDDGDNDVSMVRSNGLCSSDVCLRYVGARPALQFSSISSIPTNGECGKRGRDGVLEVKYGYYPQKAASKEIQERLEREYKNGRLSKTRNSYTTDSVAYDDYQTSFQQQTHQEYQYNGNGYV